MVNEKEEFKYANIILIFFTSLFFLINLMILIIHYKKPLLREGFFIVIFVQIFMEALISLSLLIMNIIYLINFPRGEWFLTFPALFNFAYITNTLYNIRIVIYLMTINKDNEETVEYDDCDETERNNLTRNSTIGLIQNSYKSFHICCFLLSIMHTILYIINLLYDKESIESEDWNWYYYFLNGSKGAHRFAFFIFHIIFFGISIPYLCLSLNKEKISEHILLKRFSIYCIFSAIISLLFPISLSLKCIMEYFLNDNDNINDNINDIIYLTIMTAFVVYLLITSYFRVNCYYVQYILEQKGKSFCKKFCSGLNILFCCGKIRQPNFVDLNSAFIYHSLANLNDFLQELTDMKDEENKDQK